MIGDGPAVLRVSLEPGVGEEGFECGSSGDVGEHGAEPGPGFDGVRFAAGDEAHQDGCSVSSLGTADEQPVLSADGNGFHGSCGGVGVDREVAVFEVAVQGLPLVAGVRRGFADQAFREELLIVEPLLQVSQHGSGVFDSQLLTRSSIGVLCRTFEFIQPADDCQDMVGSGGVLFTGLVPVSARMSPARDFDNRAAGFQIDSVVATIGIRLKIAAEVFQKFLRTGAAA